MSAFENPDVAWLIYYSWVIAFSLKSRPRTIYWKLERRLSQSKSVTPLYAIERDYKHRISKVRKTFWHQKNEPFWYIEKGGVYSLWWRHILLHFPGPIVRGKKQNKMNLFIIIDIFPLWYIHGKSVNLFLVSS